MAGTEWATTPYELDDGTVWRGMDAAALRMLDEVDPLANRLPDNDDELVRELALLRPKTGWCAALGCTVSFRWPDMLSLSQGESELYAEVEHLHRMRRIWALSQARRAAGADKAARKAALGMARRAEGGGNSARAAGAVRTAKNRLRVEPEELDTEPTVMGTPYGVMDLDDGELVAEKWSRDGYNELADDSPAEMFNVTKQAAGIPSCVFSRDLDLDPDPRWEEFVLEVCCGDADLAGYLQRALGYSMLGGNPEECMFVAYGPTTRNGKDTLLESVKGAMGEYAGTAERTFLSRRRGEGSGPDEALASLVGKRLVTLAEPPKGMVLDEGKVKDLTACSTQSTSRKYGAQFEFVPQCTIWMNVNNLPSVSDDSVFEGGRIRVIPFDRHFAPEERDPSLKKRFATEAGRHTVMLWLLEGYREWKERGLDEPEAVQRATDDYADTAGTSAVRFLRKHCRIRAGARCDVKEVRELYAEFCEKLLGDAPMSQQAFAEELRPFGIGKKKSNGRQYWLGMEIASPVDEAERILERAAGDGEAKEAREASESTPGDESSGDARNVTPKVTDDGGEGTECGGGLIIYLQ